MLHAVISVILVISSVKLVQSQESCSLYYTQNNFKLTGHVVKKVNSPTKDRCIDECKLHTKCHSINYHHGDSVCELNDASHLNQPVSLVPGDGYQYVNYHHRKPTSCSSKFCSYPEVCSVKSNGKDYSCGICTGIHVFHEQISTIDLNDVVHAR